jgi:hypothetical protein
MRRLAPTLSRASSPSNLHLTLIAKLAEQERGSFQFATLFGLRGGSVSRPTDAQSGA